MPTITIHPDPAPTRPDSLRQRLAARLALRRAWSDLYAELDTPSRLDRMDRRVSA